MHPVAHEESGGSQSPALRGAERGEEWNSARGVCGGIAVEQRGRGASESLVHDIVVMAIQAPRCWRGGSLVLHQVSKAVAKSQNRGGGQ